VVERLARHRAGDEALRAIDESGDLHSFTFGEVAERAADASVALKKLGVGSGDVVMTLMGARPEWVFALLGAWRLGAVALPASEQLRRKDIALRVELARPRVVLAAGRNLGQLDGIAGLPTVLNVDEQPFPGDAGGSTAPSHTERHSAALVIFTSGTSGEPRGVIHTQAYLAGQRMQAEHWLGARAGELVWCTAASGWSKSARNSFVAPWSMGAACLLHDGRFDPAERLQIAAEQEVNVLCQSPTEYRMIARRTSLEGLRMPALRHLVSAGEPLNPEVMDAFKTAVGLDIHDGYGQTETGQLTGMPADEEVRPGSMGRPLPGFKLDVVDEHGIPAKDGELVLEPVTVPTFFRGYLGEPEHPRHRRWHTGDHVRRDADGFLWFEGRLDDVILSAGYRIGPFEVESALLEHPSVAEAAAVAAPDEERGAVVRAIVVLRDGWDPGDALAKDLQDHVKSATAPYKYPRIVEFAADLPKTSSGKIKRAALRETGGYS
jgi:acetyl-CoA synthetase